MARRNRDLAGLAALGALGYAMFGGDRNKVRPDGGAPVEDRNAPVGVGMSDGSAEAEYTGRPGRRVVVNEIGDLVEIPEGPTVRPAAPRPAPARPAAPASAAPSRSMAAPAPRRNVAGDYTRKMGATAEEIAAYRNREVTPPRMTPEMRRQAEAQALERVTPEEYLVGGPGLKTLHAAAKGLANRAPALREVTQQALPAPTKRLTGPSKADLVARDRAAREAMRREEMLQENAARYGLDPTAPGYTGAAQALRERLGGDAFTVKKKGGAIKAKPQAKKMASGGMTASKRGDGIAMRGKTKGKMY